LAIIIYPGKGGTGKTTLSALTIRHLAERGEVPLALDLDPDAHLHKLLGVELRTTVGQVVDRVHKEKHAELEPQKPPDLSDQEYFLSLIAEEVFIEEEGFDLLTLGRPSLDIDCYCPVFLWSEYAIKMLMKSYPTTYRHIVADCDPGTEIFPRRILHHLAAAAPIDHIVVVVDGSRMSLDTARSIVAEARASGLQAREVALVANRVDDPALQRRVAELAEEQYGLKVLGFVPTDPQVTALGLDGGSVFTLQPGPAYRAVGELLHRLGL
jgi:CO dehydrogenase maturation factor